MRRWGDRIHTVVVIMLLLNLLFVCDHLPLQAQIVVEDEELSGNQILTNEPLIGYRKSSADIFQTTSEGKVGISADVFVRSAKDTPEVNDVIVRSGQDPSKASIYEWYTASKSAGGLSHTSLKTPVVKTASATKEWSDPYLISSLPETEIFGSGNPSIYVKRVGDRDVQYIEVDDPSASAVFAASYKKLSSTSDMSPAQAHKGFRQVNAMMASYPFLAKATEFSLGQVSFGVPTVFNSTEKKLEIPSSIQSQNEIYWVEFAVSFRDIDLTDIATLSFGVTLPPGNVALELIPLRYDKEMDVSRSFSSPEIKVKIGNKAVELGKVFEQQVVYKSLIPTVFAEGLQESHFSWSLKDEAVQLGSRRFIGIIQVPKGKKEMTIQFQASAKTKAHWAQGDLISTKPYLAELKLK